MVIEEILTLSLCSQDGHGWDVEGELAGAPQLEPEASGDQASHLQEALHAQRPVQALAGGTGEVIQGPDLPLRGKLHAA